MPNCRNCGAEIPERARFCPACGAGQVVVGVPTLQAQPRPKKQGRWLLWLLGLAGFGVILLVVCVAIVMVWEPPEEYKVTRTARAGATATERTRLTGTAGPSPTPGPTATPTPRPVAPTCAEILNARAELTDARWDNYKDEVAGTWIIGWEGHIREVGDRSIIAGGFPVYVDVSRDCSLYYVIKSEEEALAYAKGQPVMVTGQIDYLAILFGEVTLHLEDYTVESQ